MKFSQLIHFDADRKIENMNNQLRSPIETCRMNPGKSLYLLIQKGFIGEFTMFEKSQRGKPNIL